MAYFMLVTGKQGICRGASTYRNNAGWHDLTDIARPLSGSGYRNRGRDELNRRVEVKMFEEPRARQIGLLLDRDQILPWVAVEAASSDGKPQFWWTFFDVRSAGFGAGTDYDLPTGSSMSYIFEFGSARWNTGTWPGAIPTQVPKVGLDPSRVVDRDTDQAVLALPVPDFLKRDLKQRATDQERTRRLLSALVVAGSFHAEGPKPRRATQRRTPSASRGDWPDEACARQSICTQDFSAISARLCALRVE